MQGQKIVIILLVGAFCINESISSSVPMFEFLTRDEKLTALYSMFAKQVSTYCKNKENANVAECKREMMVYGMDKLNKMEESHLDEMSPFQKDSDAILWDSIMENHDDDTKKPSAELVQDERQIYLQKEQLHQQNPLFKDESSDDLDDGHQNYLQHSAATHNSYAYASKPNDLDNHEPLEQNTNYLMGPMVSIMMPDGTPVKGQVQFIMPADDDMDDMTMGQGRMPSIQELLDSMTMDEKPKIIMEMPPSSTTTTVRTRAAKTIRSNYRNHVRQ